MEKRRNEVISSIREAIREAGKLRPYQGDASLRDAYKQAWTMHLNIFVEDYHKVMDMEEIAERSYDAMEQYLLIQEKAREKMNLESNKLDVAYKAFAAKNNIRLVDNGPSKLGRKLEKTGRVNKYMSDLFLIYFKSNVQEKLVIEALNKDDLNALEQSKASLAKYSAEGLSRLDTIKPFDGDGSLINACRKVLEFQKEEAGKLGVYSDFLMKKQEFEKAKKAFDIKSDAQRTQKDIDQFNTAVNSFNRTVAEFNKVNEALNSSRERVHTGWEDSRKRFMDRHIPKG
jgi:hypothetical protein